MRLGFGIFIVTLYYGQAYGLKMIGPFNNGRPIPIECGWSSGNNPPTIYWSDIPQKTKSLALICEDPDAKLCDDFKISCIDPQEDAPEPRTHWVIYNIPVTISSFPSMVDGVKEGMNSYGTKGYVGPFPREGLEHRYLFKLYALDKTLDIPEGSTKEELEVEMKGHILDTAQLVGTYLRNNED